MQSVADWIPADRIVLEPNARRAVTNLADNLAVTAGPGAGKTELLAQRADFLLRTGICRYPKRVLAISFKVDASQNLRDRVRQRCGDEFARRLDSHTFHAFAKRIIDQFRLALTGRDALDADYQIADQRIYKRTITFADLIPLAVKIVEANALVRTAIRKTYSHVFLDEFQDCTRLQYRLVKACFHGTGVRVTAVGDTKQRIMAWAGALDGIFRTYAVDFGAVELTLYQNYRSAPRLRRMQNAMIREMDPKAALDDGDIRGKRGDLGIMVFEDNAAEADGLADLIAGWVDDEGANPSDIAVLVSKQQQLYCQKLTAALEVRGVPFREEDRLQDLAAEPVCRLVVDFLLAVAGGLRPTGHRRLLDVVLHNKRLDEEQEFRERSKWSRLLADMGRRVAIGEIDLRERTALAMVVEDLVTMLGNDALVALSGDYAHGDRLRQLIGNAIDRISELLSIGGDVPAALARFSGDWAVRIMSIHKSKGLEFDNVIVLGVEKQTFWGDLEAERSAFFVAISRAKHRLFLTVARYRERPKGAQRWDEERSPKQEFLAYAEPYANE